MKTISIFQKLTLLCVMGLISFSLNAQTIITIDNNPGSLTTYQSIQAAHDAATSGDIIYVQPSVTSYGNLTLTKPLTIVGRSHSEPDKRSEIGTVSVRTSGVTLEGLYTSSISTSTSSTPNTPPFVGLNITECSTSSITIGSSSFSSTPIIDDVLIRGNVIRSSLNIRKDAINVIVSNNILLSNLETYITNSIAITNNVFKFTSSTTIENNTASGILNLHNNMFIINTSGTSSSFAKIYLRDGFFNLSNNLTYNYGTGNDPEFVGFSGGSFTETATLANTDPLFTDVNPADSDSFAGSSTYNPGARLADDLTLQASSPALTGGGGSTEIGLYGNSFIYDVLGNPKGYPLLDVLTYDGAVPKNGNINVNIKAVAK